MKKKTIFLLILIVSGLPILAPAVHAQKVLPYLSPLPGSTMVSPATTIVVRPGDFIDVHSLNNGLFDVVGSFSGAHKGQAILSDDERTIVFKPDQPFALGETVSVQLMAGLKSSAGETLGESPFSFRISAHSAVPIPREIMDADLPEAARKPSAPASAQTTNQWQYLTLPDDFPRFTVTVPANGVDVGSIFATPFTFSGQHSYLLIMDDTGQPVYYQQMPINTLNTDLRRQPNGLLTYFDASLGYYVALNSSYKPVDTYRTGNGYATDLHEFQMLPNGHALLMAYDWQPVDMSQLVIGGVPTATVVGLIVQELDLFKNVVFQWRSWDHINITDTAEPLTTTVIDYVHGNAIEQDQDGNLLISSRHLDEITKIDRQTGNILWRWGGKNNQFTFVNDPDGFVHQHDIRRLTNGHLTLWDNHNGSQPPYSRPIDYEMDEAGKVVTLTWQFRNSPDVYSPATGNNQWLPNGNRIAGWGFGGPFLMTELRPDNSKALEFLMQPQYVNYRALRFPWHGNPDTQPTLVAQSTGPTTTLAYSWNGATEIASYKVYGGDSPYPTDLVATQPRTGFEDHTVLVNEHRYCYFRVMPVDNLGNDTRYSNEVYTRQACYNGKLFFPFVMN